MKLIVGLGNPGRKYERTRHNLGFLCVNRIGNQFKIKLNKSQGKARTGTGTIFGEPVILARPQTFMNLSGQSVKLLMNKFHVVPEDVIVIFDDLDLPVGKIRVRQGGGPGGHNGIKSIIFETGTRDFNRVRIGIGRPPAFQNARNVFENDVIDYVLSEFTNDEKKVIEPVISTAAEAAVSIIADGLVAAMNKYNGNSGGSIEKD